VTVSWFGPQNQAGFGLLVAPQKRRREDDVRHTSRSGGLLRRKASLTRIFQFSLKTDGGVTTVGARDIITDVASS
jgi:hypothetical protein